MKYTAPWWLPGGHLQTIWPALRRVPPVHGALYQRERWLTPDRDFVDVDWLTDTAPSANGRDNTRPLLVLFHGLEGSSDSHYARAFARQAQQQGWAYAVPHFRGCSGDINTAPRAYHSGDYAEIDWMLRRFQQQHAGPILAVGISLGGNALLRWAQETGAHARLRVRAIAAICAPVDLAASGRALERGWNRSIYTPMFLRSMKPKALRKLAQYPGLFDAKALMAARTLYEFDNVFTAPLHGYANTDDYWARASAKPHLKLLQLPTLLVHARNDPFIPAWSLPQQREVSEDVTLWQPQTGGHVGFAGHCKEQALHILPQAIAPWLSGQLNGEEPSWTTS